MVRSFVLGTLLFSSFSLLAQQRSNHWCFGDSAYLEFTSTGPVHQGTSAFWGEEAVSTISDSTGNLLMYSNGKNIWDRNHGLMPNGTDLFVPDGVPYDLFFSVAQGSMILPAPSNASHYYVFSLQNQVPYDSMHFFYSKVDMALNGGFGDVLPSERAVPIWDTTTLENRNVSSEKMTAVKHGNGRDWWVLLYFNTFSSTYTDSLVLRYLLTPSGITYGGKQAVPTYGDYPNFQGQMKLSPQGDKLAVGGSNSRVVVYEFDRCSGLVGDVLLVDTLPEMSYSCEFSPNGELLYVAKFKAPPKVIQYNLNATTQSDIKQPVYTGPGGKGVGQLQRGPDGKIYFPIIKDAWPNTNADLTKPWSTNLSVINQPNLLGLDCDLDTFTISLGGRRAFLGLPNQPNYDLGALAGSPCDTLGFSSGLHEEVSAGQLNIFPNPATNSVFLDVGEGENKQFMEVQLFDLSQQLLLRHIVQNAGKAKLIEVDVTTIEPGLYIFRLLSSSGKSYSGIFLKQ